MNIKKVIKKMLCSCLLNTSGLPNGFNPMGNFMRLIFFAFFEKIVVPILTSGGLAAVSASAFARCV